MAVDLQGGHLLFDLGVVSQKSAELVFQLLNVSSISSENRNSAASTVADIRVHGKLLGGGS